MSLRTSGSYQGGLASGFSIPAATADLEADLFLPADPDGVVVMAHGAGASRHSARTRYLAEHLHGAGFATLLVDLLDAAEQELDAATSHLQFDLELMADRLAHVVDWAVADRRLRSLPIGCTAAHAAGGAVLLTAVARPAAVRAVVARGGRLELVGRRLTGLRAPTLLIAGGRDPALVRANAAAMGSVPGLIQLDVIPGETRAFDGPGALEEVARLTVDWFGEHLAPLPGAA